MQTLSISLPQKLTTRVDTIIEEEGYASRSEFFRTLLRLYLQLSARAEVVAEKPFFLPFKKRPLNEIRKDLSRGGFYSQEFVNSVVEGLEKSSLYANKTTKS